MIVVIIAGGSGTRLWPLSTQKTPKHLLSLTDEKSLLQNTVDRVRRLASAEKIFVIPESSHADQVYEQIPEIPKENILVEPARRGTASCVAWGLATIKQRDFGNEPIVFLWADNLIRDTAGFAADILLAGQVSQSEGKVVFVGLEPTYPSTGFGYIHKGGLIKGWDRISVFKKFVEKPDKQTAQKYYTSGEYLWNMGYLVGTIDVFENAMKTQAPEMLKRYETLLHSKDIEKSYNALESIAVDYVFSEKLVDALVISGSFDWADIGSFKDLHEVSLQDEEGNHIRGGDVHLEGVTNSFVRNEVAGQPIAVIGLDGVVVINTGHGILIANKNHSQKVGDIAKKLQS